MNRLKGVFQMAEESEHPTRLSFGQFINIGLRLLEDAPNDALDCNRLDYHLVLEALRDGKKVIFAYVHETQDS